MCDFVILNPDNTPAAILGEDRIDKVLRIDISLSNSLIRAVNRMSIDAVLLKPLADGEIPLSIRQLMACQRLISGLSKHLMAAMPPGLPIDNLESLWDLGARGVAVDLAIDNPEQRLSQVKEAIEKLPTTRKKPREKVNAVLPFSRTGSNTMPPDDDDDEDDF